MSGVKCISDCICTGRCGAPWVLFFVPAISWIPPSYLLPGFIATIGFHRLVCIFLSLSLLWWVFWISVESVWFGPGSTARGSCIYLPACNGRISTIQFKSSFSTGTFHGRLPEALILLLTFRRELLRTHYRYTFLPGTDHHLEHATGSSG